MHVRELSGINFSKVKKELIMNNNRMAMKSCIPPTVLLLPSQTSPKRNLSSIKKKLVPHTPDSFGLSCQQLLKVRETAS
jgi:hypothetical protein